MREELYLTRAEINLRAASENIKIIRQAAGANVFAVVKADAYAHGAEELAPVFLKAGATHLCTACAEEGIRLRNSGIKSAVIILNPAAPFEIEAITEHRLSPAIGDIKTAEKFSETSKKMKTRIKIHVEIDTGMGRSGFLPEEALQSVKKITGMEGIEIEGVFTHFACADEEEPSYTVKQIQLFEKLTSDIESEGITIPFKHISNSAGIIAFPHKKTNAVRPGLLLYGISPFTDKPAPTLPIMEVKSRIINIRKIPPGASLSYGRTYKTSAETSIATLAAGYADGYDRRLSNKARVLIKGQSAPIVGRICMDRCLADVTNIPAKTGDEAVLIGKQEEKSITVEELSRICGTIPNEFISRLGKRIKRIYK